MKCILCFVGAERVKLKRQWVHHIPQLGKIIVCVEMQLKPVS